MTDTMKGLQLSIETVFDAADGGKLFQVRCIADHSAFTICPPRKDRLEAVSLRRAFEDALRSVIAAEVEASRLPQAGAGDAAVQQPTKLSELRGLLRHDQILPADASAWQPNFDAISVKQELLVMEFCAEIAGPRGHKGSPPDPVRLLEMAQALYEAERDDFAATSPLPTAPGAKIKTLDEFFAEAERTGLTIRDLLPALAARPEFADCVGLPTAPAAPTLEEAYAEGRKDEIEHLTQIGALTDCTYCNGSGEREMYDTSIGPDARAEFVNCPDCKGTGYACRAALAAAPLDRIALSETRILEMWVMRPSIHNGELSPQLIDFARAIEAEHGITLAQKGDVK